MMRSEGTRVALTTSVAEPPLRSAKIRAVHLRFVPIKAGEQQARLAVHRARELMEYGIVIPAGLQRLRRALPGVLSAADDTLPTLARVVVSELQARLQEVDERITGHERQIEQLARQDEVAKRLMAVQGVGPITATAVVATVGDATAFHHGRQFAAWLGLVPKQFSTGGKSVLGRIPKRGNVYLRTLLLHGARAVVQYTAKRTDQTDVWQVRITPSVRTKTARCMGAVRAYFHQGWSNATHTQAG